MKPVDAFLAAVKQRQGISTDQEIAVRLGLGRSAIATWRMRQRIPKEPTKALEEWSGLDFDRFVREHFATQPLAAYLIEAAYLWALASYFSGTPAASNVQTVAGLTSAAPSLRNLVSNRLYDASGGEVTFETYSSLAKMVFEGKFLSVEEVRDAYSKHHPFPVSQ